MKTRKLSGLALLLALAACGTETPTEPAAPAAPRFNGGGMTFGGGTATQAGDCEEDRGGGMTFGGGTYTGPSCPTP